MGNWGKSERHRGIEKRGQSLPSRKDKNIIDLLRGQRIPSRNQPDVFQIEFSPPIPDGGEVRDRHADGGGQILALIAVGMHDFFKHRFIHRRCTSLHFLERTDCHVACRMRPTERASADPVQRPNLVLGFTSPETFLRNAGNKVDGLHQDFRILQDGYRTIMVLGLSH